MGGLFGGGKQPQAQKTQPAGALNIQTSSYGAAKPLIYGKNRVAINLVHYFNFKPIAHVTKQKTGGKGGPKSTSNTTYTYKVGLLCGVAVELEGIGTIWKNKEKHTLASLGFTFLNGKAGQTAWVGLPAGEAVPYANLAGLAHPAFDLGDSPSLPNINVEAKGLCPYNPGTIDDALPSDIIVDYLTDGRHGAGFAGKLADLDAGPASFRKYVLARGLFISPIENNQRQAGAFIKEIADICNSAIVWREGKMNLIPYGDATISGNGATYTPDLTPLYDLGPDDFLAERGRPPVQHKEKPPEQQFNHHRIEYNARSNDYNPLIVNLKDQADIDDNGLRTKAVTTYKAITLDSVARDVLQIQQQRDLHVKNTYSFRLGIRHSLLEPMDYVTLTEPGLGLDRQLVRLVDCVEQDDALDCVAEEVNIGVASSPLFNTVAPGGYNQDYNASPGSVTDPLIMNAPGLLTETGYEQWIAVAGLNPNWGGCVVWASDDNLEYRRVGEVMGAARYGSVAGAALPAGTADYDTTSVLRVQLYTGQLLAGTQLDCDQYRTLLYVGGEWMSYRDAVLVSGTTYDVDTLRRAAYGSDRTSHAIGQGVAVVDEAIFRMPYDKGNVGRTVYFKFQSFNVFGGGFQDLDACTAYSHTMGASELTAPMNLADIGGNGVNILPDQYSTYEAATLPAITVSPVIALARTTDGNSVIKNSLYMGTGAATAWFGSGFNIPLTPGKRYLVSFWARSSQAGNTFRPFIETAAGYNYGSSLQVNAANVFQRVSTIIDMTANTQTIGWLGITKEQSEAGYIDGLMVEEAVGVLNKPSGYTRGRADGVALSALIAAQNAQATADGQIDIYRQATAPSIGGAGAKLGDYWQDSDDGKWWYCNGSSWVESPDSRLPQVVLDAAAANSAANTAQSTANQRIRLFVQEAQPSGGTYIVGDQWYKPSTKETRYFNGSGWSALADQASAATPNAVMNPSFEQGELHWAPNGGTGFYVEANANALHGSNLLVKYLGSANAEFFNNTGQLAVDAGGRVRASARVRHNGDPSAGTLSLIVYCYSANGGYISQTSVKQYTTASMAANTWRAISGLLTVPTGTVFVRVGIGVSGYASGVWYIDTVGLELAPTNVDEVPDGSTYAKPRATTLLGGVPQGMSWGANLVPNSSFAKNLSQSITNTPPAGQTIVDDWIVNYYGYHYVIAEGPGILMRVTQVLPANLGYTATQIYSSRFDVISGRQYRVSAFVSNSRNATPPANVSWLHRLHVYWLNAANAVVGHGEYDWWNGVGEHTIEAYPIAPVGAVRAQINCEVFVANTNNFAVDAAGALWLDQRWNTIQFVLLNNMDSEIQDGSTYGRFDVQDGFVGSTRRIGLNVKGSRKILGGARNSRANIVHGIAAVRTTGALTADSSGNVTVNAHSVEISGETVTYNAVTNAVTGLTVGVSYIIFTLDPYLDGGTRTYYAQTSSLSAQQAGEGAVMMGNVTIPSSGSSGGGGGGGGLDPCVDINSFMPEGHRAGEVAHGDFVQCWDECSPPAVVQIPCESNYPVHDVECWRIVSESGASVVASHCTPMTLRDLSIKYLPEMLGEEVLVQRDGELTWERVVRCERAGLRTVAKIKVFDSMYFAGETEDATIATHNPTYKP